MSDSSTSPFARSAISTWNRLSNARGEVSTSKLPHMPIVEAHRRGSGSPTEADLPFRTDATAVRLATSYVRWPSPLPACSDARLAPERPPLLGACPSIRNRHNIL